MLGRPRRSVGPKTAQLNLPVPLSDGASLRTQAEEAIAPGDPLGWDDLDRVAVEAQARDQPGIVVEFLLDALGGAPGHDLTRQVPGRRLADADQRVVSAAEVGVHGGDRVDAV